MEQEVYTGKVKFFNKSKGFGFLIQDGQGQELFYHVTKIKGQPPKDNDKVQFEIEQGQRGPFAKNVEII